MSFFGDDNFQNFEVRLKHLKFKEGVRDIFNTLAKAGWKARLTIWNPETGVEFEITPVSARRTKGPKASRVEVDVPDVDQDSPI